MGDCSAGGSEDSERLDVSRGTSSWQSRFMFHVEHQILRSVTMFHVEHSGVMRVFSSCRTSMTTLYRHPAYLVRSDPPVGVADECTAPRSARHLAGGAIRHRRHVAVSPTSAHHVEGACSVGSLRSPLGPCVSARLRRQCATHAILLWRWSMRDRTPSLHEGSEDHPPGRVTSDVLRGGKKTGDVCD